MGRWMGYVCAYVNVSLRTREQYETEEGRHIIIIIFTPTIREAFAPSVTASDGLAWCAASDVKFVCFSLCLLYKHLYLTTC